MASIFPNGTQYAFSTAFGSAIPVTAISNAVDAECAAAAPPTDGSVAVITSGWTALNNTVARTDGADTDSFLLEDVDTTSTTQYPAGEGAGSVKIVSTWETLSQIQDANLTGGEQQFYTRQDLEDVNGRQIQIPTHRNARTLAVSLEYDPDLDWYAALVAADIARTPVVMRAILPGGDTLYYFGYPAFNKVPTQAKNQGMKVDLSLALLCEPIRYAAA